jgi:glucose/arabinose dehydrogenase
MYNLKPINLIILIFLFLILDSPYPAISAVLDDIELPDGFEITEYAKGLGDARFMAESPEGVLFVASMDRGEVLALPDKNKDGKADGVKTYVSGLKRPNSIAFHDGYIYVGETDKISRFKYDGYDKKPGKKEVLVSGLPNNGHFTKTVEFGPDGKMYVSMGSSCNVCLQKDDRRATILLYSPEGKDGEVYASGLRNSVGLEFHPETGELWATDNGRDRLGDDIPPDEVNVIKKGKDYGWPYCYGDKIPDPDYGEPRKCTDTVEPVVKMQAHSAPLGLVFYDGDMFPDEYKGDLFVAYHGSWNRSVPTGYKVVRIKMKNGQPDGINDFAYGWLQGEKRSGRPVDVLVGPFGELFVSDDMRGVIYRITFVEKN